MNITKSKCFFVAQSCAKCVGRCGIRTLVGLPPNGFQGFYADDERSERRDGESDTPDADTVNAIRRNAETVKAMRRNSDTVNAMRRNSDTVKAMRRNADIKRSAVGSAQIREFFPCPFSGL